MKFFFNSPPTGTYPTSSQNATLNSLCILSVNRLRGKMNILTRCCPRCVPHVQNRLCGIDFWQNNSTILWTIVAIFALSDQWNTGKQNANAGEFSPYRLAHNWWSSCVNWRWQSVLIICRKNYCFFKAICTVHLLTASSMNSFSSTQIKCMCKWLTEANAPILL